jgi:hypothetical protein
MMTLIPPRLRLPALYFLIGLLFAAAWLVRGGKTWWISILTIVAFSARCAFLYWGGGQDTDAGALVGSHPDERQRLLSTRSQALAMKLAAVSAFAGLTIAVAIRAAWWWPFAILLAVLVFGYLLGLSVYGVAQEDPAADDLNSDLHAPFPVG